MEKLYRAKELSWLAFNERVLQESESEDVPIIERIKFLGIYSNNLDEFFRVRVATLKRLSNMGKKAKQFLGYDPKEVLLEINSIVVDQRKRFEINYKKILLQLAEQNIHIINEDELLEEHEAFISDYFYHNVRPRLNPIMLDQAINFPDLKENEIYFAIQLLSEKREQYAILEIPGSLPRFLQIPSKEKTYIILLDDIIRFRLKDVFPVFDYDKAKAFTIKLTKDAELDIVDDISESYVENMTRSLKRRKKNNPVRFVYDRNIPEKLLYYITEKLKFNKLDAVIAGGRYHNFKDFISFPKVGGEGNINPQILPIPHPEFIPGKSFFAKPVRKDILLYFPYHSFNNFIDLLREAAIDPKVQTIKITLYRLAKNSTVINALINAVKNGKTVIAIVELQARFDEEANIYWSQKLSDGGVKVIYGVPNLKVHSKLLLITRQENKSLVNFAGVGTGNFNEDTAKIYTDHLLLTFDRKITNEVVKVFNFFERNFKRENFNHFILSPFYTRNRFINLIQTEIENAKAGKQAFIYLKINNLVDREIIEWLYEASKAKVDIKLNVRGMFSLIPGIKGFSDHIEAKAIIDRYLEHTRFIIFCNNGDEKYFISSADWMTRNIERRVEVTCPIYDKNIQKQLKDIFMIQWKDNVKARILDCELRNNFYSNNNPPFRSQIELYKYLADQLNKK
ncbi:MAG: polyphosphate kinase 1 [Bacteroidales bacterium]|nr:polyphosphate kinase 1 [Bacteroidales bacterium]